MTFTIDTFTTVSPAVVYIMLLVSNVTSTNDMDIIHRVFIGKRHFKFLPLPPARVTVYKRLQLVCQERSKFEFLVAPKSMQSWLYFIDYGFIMPKKYRGSDDPYGLDGKINSSISFCNSTDAARENTKRILEEGSGYDSMLVSNQLTPSVMF